MTRTDRDRFEQRLWGELKPLLDQRSADPVGAASHSGHGVLTLRRVAVLLVLTVISAGALTVFLARGDGNDRVFAQELADGRLRLDLARYFGSADVARAELEEAGIDVRVEQPVASPSMVGKVSNIMLDHDAAGVEVEQGVRNPDEVAVATIDPEVFDDTVTLVVPRAPREGEALEIAGPVFEEGEPLEGLWCEQWPLTTQQFADAAAGQDLEVVWEVVTEVTPNAAHREFSDLQIKYSSERPDGRVLFAALATNSPVQPDMPVPGSVVATVIPDDVETRPDIERGLAPDANARSCDG